VLSIACEHDPRATQARSYPEKKPKKRLSVKANVLSKMCALPGEVQVSGPRVPQTKKRLKNPFDFIGRPGYLAWQHCGYKNTGLRPKLQRRTPAKPPRVLSGDAQSLYLSLSADTRRG
jgi:hypothetical protein